MSNDENNNNAARKAGHFAVRYTEAEAEAVGYAVNEKIRTTRANLAYMQRSADKYGPEQIGYIRDLIERLENASVSLESGKWDDSAN